MNDFVLLYQGGDPTWTERSPDEIEAAMAEWRRWFKDLEASGNLRSSGAALAPGGIVVRKNGISIVTDAPLAEVKELVGGYSVIRAESLEAAAEIAGGSPFLASNPEGRVLVRPVVPTGE